MDTWHFRIPYPLPTLNEWERMHFWTKKDYKRNLAQEVKLGLRAAGWRFSRPPLRRCAITVERCSVGSPDPDNVIAKPLLDVLQPPSKRHPLGLNVIADDSAEVIVKLKVFGVKIKRDKQCTLVTIEEKS